MFKGLVLQTTYNLADEQVEYQIRDRLSFGRFLGLGIEVSVQTLPVIPAGTAGIQTPWRAYRKGGLNAYGSRIGCLLPPPCGTFAIGSRRSA
jgi:hypothetical protein